MEQERELVLAAQQDPAAFEPLYEQYVAKIYRYLSFKTNSTAEAEDLTSQTFCEALENLSKYQWKGVSFGAWLYRIAYNLLMDHYKKPGLDSLEENVDDGSDLMDEVGTKWSLDRVYDVLKTLPELSQQVVALRVSEGLSHKEIAKILGKSEDNIKVVYSRAVQALKDKIVFVVLLLIFFLQFHG